MYFCILFLIPNMGGSRGGTGSPATFRISQVAICFLRNSGMDPYQEEIGPLGPIASRGRSI